MLTTKNTKGLVSVEAGQVSVLICPLMARMDANSWTWELSLSSLLALIRAIRGHSFACLVRGRG